MFIEQPKDEEKEKKQVNDPTTQTVGSGGGGANTAGGLGTAPGGNMSTITPVAPEQPTQKWATAQDYLKANQPQANILGQKVSESLTGTLGETQKIIGQEAEEAQQEIKAGTTEYNPDIVKTAKETPTEITGSPTKLQDFLKQWNASYTGPTDFASTEHYQPAAQAAQKAKDTATQLGTTGGREELLGKQFGTYGAGNRGLDQAVLQQAEQYGQIQAMTPQFEKVQDYLKAKSGEVGQAAQLGQFTTQAAKNMTQSEVQQGLEDFKNQIAAKTGQTQQQANKELQDLRAALINNQPLSDQQLQLMGITREQFNALQDKANKLAELDPNFAVPASATAPSAAGVRTADVKANAARGTTSPLQQYLTLQNPEAVYNMGNVATPEERAKAEALAQLTGGTSFLPSSSAPGKLANFDYQKALNDYAAKINEIETLNAEERARLIAEEQQRLADLQHEQDVKENREKIQGDLNLATLGWSNLVTAPFQEKPLEAFGQGLEHTYKQALDRGEDALSLALKYNPMTGFGVINKPAEQTYKKAVTSVKKTANKAKSWAKKTFCFDPSTLVQINETQSKPICTIRLGEKIMGGIVESVRVSLTHAGSRYNYNGVIVTGSHAVYEDGKWVRVENSKQAKPIDGEGVVFSLVTSDHRIFSNGVEFADEHESDFYETLSINESLDYLNGELAQC